MSRAGSAWHELGRLIDLVNRLRDNEAGNAEAARERDQRIGRNLSEASDRQAMLDAWLAAVRDPASPKDRGPPLAERSLRTAGTGVTLAGLLLGVIASGVVLGYTGRHPVNVVTVLGVFVVLQGATLLVTLIGLTPASGRVGVGRWPVVSGLCELARVLSPGRLAGPVMRVLPGELRRHAEPMWDEAAGYRGALAAPRQASMLAFAQGFGLAFNVAALVWLVCRVVFTDLAFGWSTTLSVEPATMQALTTTLALPWGWAWPAAVPSLELIEQTRYFRVSGVSVDVDAELLGRWWPFLVMCIAAYGVLPRALAWGWSRRHVAKVSHEAALGLPGVSLVLMRLERAKQKKASGGDVAEALAQDVAGRAGEAVAGSGFGPIVVSWAGAPLPAIEGGDEGDGDAVLRAGGGRDVRADLAAIEGVRRCQADRPVMIVTKAWEPPLAELFDFAQTLRETPGQDEETRSDHRRPVWFLPVGVDASGTACEAAAESWDMWRKTVASQRDPGLRVLRWREVVA